MAREKEQHPEETPRGGFVETMDCAFDVASGGVGIHTYAVNNLFDNKILSQREKETIVHKSANLLNNPYVQGWEDQWARLEVPKEYKHPDTSMYLDLISFTQQTYNQTYEQTGMTYGNPSAFEAPALYKLAAMLGIMQQIAFHADRKGEAIPKSYSSSKWKAEWERIFQKKIPSVESLYQEGYQALAQYAPRMELKSLPLHLSKEVLVSLAKLPAFA